MGIFGSFEVRSNGFGSLKGGGGSIVSGLA
jgi:hypothetical protein